MAYLLDTNVLSELVKPLPNKGVLVWFAAQRAEDLFLAAVSLGELVRGAVRLKSAARRSRFENWINEEVVVQFEGRILPYDQKTARKWGQIMGDGDRTGNVLPFADAQIAAVALRFGHTIVTRDTQDFARMSADLFNPWS